MHLEIDFKIGIQLIGICSAPDTRYSDQLTTSGSKQVALLTADCPLDQLTRAGGNLRYVRPHAILSQTKSVNPQRQREAVLTCNH